MEHKIFKHKLLILCLGAIMPYYCFSQSNDVYFSYNKHDMYFYGGMHFLKLSSDSVIYYHFGIDKSVEVRGRIYYGKYNSKESTLIFDNEILKIGPNMDTLNLKKICLVLQNITYSKEDDLGRFDSWEETFYKLSNKERLNVCLNAYYISRLKKTDPKYVSFSTFKQMQNEKLLDLKDDPKLFEEKLGKEITSRLPRK